MATRGGYYRNSDQSIYEPISPNPWVTHLILLSMFLYVLFEERFAIGVNTGGRGALQPIDFLVPLVGVLVFFGMGGISGLHLLRLGTRGLFWVPYALLTTVLPVLGVLVKGEPIRTMYTSIHGVIEVSFILFGAWAAFHEANIRTLARGYAWFAIIAESLFALLDYLNKTGMYPTAIGQFLLQWNTESEGTMGEFTFLTWRCVGTYTNPNDLGFWSVVAFWTAALLFRGMFRFTGILAALLTLLLSQSRGSMISLLITSAVWFAYVALSRDAGLKKARDATYLTAIGFLLVVAWLAAALSQSDGVVISDKFSFVQRFERGLDVLTQGAGADPNSKARVAAWEQALDFYYENPVGTWCSPRLKFHLYIDSEYVKTLLQGSIPYLLSLVLLIACSFRRITSTGMTSRVTAMIALTAAVNGMSAYPWAYPAVGIFWSILGYDLTADRIRARVYHRRWNAYDVPSELVTEQG